MAIVKSNLLTQGLSGKIGNQLVFKVYGNKTVVTAYPQKSSVPASELQMRQRGRFARAVATMHFWLSLPHKRRFLEGLKRK